MRKIIALAIITSLSASGTAFARDGSGGGAGAGGAGDSNGWDRSINSLGNNQPGVSEMENTFIKIRDIDGEAEVHTGNHYSDSIAQFPSHGDAFFDTSANIRGR